MRGTHRLSLLAPLLLGVSTLGGGLEAQQLAEARRPHAKERAQALTTEGRSARIVLKFHEGTGVGLGERGLQVAAGFPQIGNPYVPRLDRKKVEADLRVVARVVEAEGLSVAPLILQGPERLRQDKLRAEAYWRREVADMRLYFQLVLPRWGKGTNVRGLVAELNGLASVEIAYAPAIATPLIVDEVATPPEIPYACTPDDLGDPPDFEPEQGYLSAAPLGIDALAAWTYSGGRGDGIRVVDVEGGYREHADHGPLQFITGHQMTAHREHGRAVVGILASLDNGVGTTGIVSDADIIFRSIYNSNIYDDWEEANSDAANVANHLYWASQHSMEGVVLIELQRPGPGGQVCPCPGATCSSVPMEYWPDIFDQVQTSTGNGVVVVEAAGNGGRNLDDPVFAGAFDAAVQDSGAILVGGSESATRVPLCALNSGSRVNVHSWGEGVVTTNGYHPLLWSDNTCNVYHGEFNGTSSASAIVAGAAASLQGIAQANLGYRLDPLALRQLLVDTGTPQAPGPNGELIGPQPDLTAAIEELLP